MVRKRRDPRQARAQAKVAVILEAAALILRQGGREALTTNRIAERAGVGIGTLYEYFPGKHAILVALGRQLLQADGRAVLAVLDDPATALLDPDDRVRPLIAAVFARHQHDTAFRRIVLSAYFGEGLGVQDARQIQEQIALIARHPNGPLAHRTLDATQTFVVTRAMLGLARTMTDDDAWTSLSRRQIENETLRMIGAYLAALAD